MASGQKRARSEEVESQDAQSIDPAQLPDSACLSLMFQHHPELMHQAAADAGLRLLDPGSCKAYVLLRTDAMYPHEMGDSMSEGGSATVVAVYTDPLEASDAEAKYIEENRLHGRHPDLHRWRYEKAKPCARDSSDSSELTDAMLDWYERGDRFISARILRSCSNLQSETGTRRSGSKHMADNEMSYGLAPYLITWFVDTRVVMFVTLYRVFACIEVW